MKLLSLTYVCTILLLFFYSYTQVDLSLTFSKFAVLRQIISAFQYVGYFNRPLATILYIAIISLLTACYVVFIRLARLGNISRQKVWLIILVAGGILLFSYNAFSYDIFNYIFDAKIVTHYHQNPYEHKALDYPGDPMLSFMRWTHRVYPYGPVWLGLTIPLSFLGMNIFILTFILFKALAVISYLGSCWLVEKISDRIFDKKTLVPLIVFALNPLIMVESLISGHLDIVMVFFALWGLLFLFEKKYILAGLLLLLSIGIKFMTVFLVPLFLGIYILQNKPFLFAAFSKFLPNGNIKTLDSLLTMPDYNRDILLFQSSVLMIIPTIIAASRGNFQAWYLVSVIPWVFLTRNIWMWAGFVVASVILLFMYVPYLYLGNWDQPVPMILTGIIISSVVAGVVALTIAYVAMKKGNG